MNENHKPEIVNALCYETKANRPSITARKGTIKKLEENYLSVLTDQRHSG